MKLRKYAAIALAGAMCMSLLAGCGDKKDDTSKDSTTASNAEATSGESTDASAEEENIKATITVWGPAEDQSPDYGEWLQGRCEAFNKEHPNWDLSFEYGTCSEADAGKTVTQDVSASADVYMFANDQLQTLIDANAISELGGSTADYVKSTNSQAVVDSITADGGIYGVPFTTNTWFLYYNKKVYSDSDVKSLDTMLEKGKVAFPLTNGWYNAAFYLANGCTLFGDGTDNDAGINFGGDNGKAVTDYLVDLVANKNFVNDESGVGISGMTDGSIAAMFSGSWDYKALHDALGDDLGIAAMPTVKIGGSDKQLLSFAGSKAIGVNPNCEYPQVAVALALYLGNEESQQSHYEARSIVPCNTNLLESDTVKNDALVTAQNDTFNNTSMIQPFVPKMGNFWTPAENFGKALLNGEVTHDNAAEQTEAFNTSLNTDVAE